MIINNNNQSIQFSFVVVVLKMMYYTRNSNVCVILTINHVWFKMKVITDGV